mmetsp:Transcript_40149/g.81031  ORF Transcript_40149/g.81031 Transcript_40149/m.81031 type:complete len:395 (-) Transcript_40149:151-1335(-)
MSPPNADSNDFLAETAERSDMNQYWFSRDTISAFVAEITDAGGSAALVSSPSVYFSLPDSIRAKCKVLDFDRQWGSDPGYVFYDFNDPEAIPAECHHAFDFVLVDPPFITREVWEKYATTTKLLARDGGRILCTTIAESVDMMREFLDLHPVLFRPSIPSLVYQYSVYTNYESPRLSKLNPEVDDEDWRLAGAPLGQAKEAPSRGCREVLQESSIPNITNGNPQGPEDIEKDQGAPKEVDATPVPPEVLILAELREKLNELKKATEALNSPLQLALRRRDAGGEAAALATSRADAAIEAAALAAEGLKHWSSAHSVELLAALGENCGDPDMWHAQAVSELVARARGLDSMDAFKSFALLSRQHAGALFRLSGKLLDHMKTLKKRAAAARSAPAA